MMRFLPLVLVAGLSAADGIAPEPAVIERRVTLWTAPVSTLDLAPEVAGRLVAVVPQPGDALPEGTVVSLDPELADLAVAQAEAAQAQARAELAAAAAGRAARQADLRRSVAGRAQADRERERFTLLRDEQRVSETELDRVGVAAAQAAQSEQAAAADAAAAEATPQAAEARQRTADTQFATARAQRARHDLAGPAGWIVLARLQEPGAMLAAGTPVLRLADVSRLVLAARLDEAELTDLRRRAADGGIAVGFPGAAPATAAIRRIDVTYDPASRKRLVELVIPGTAAPEASGGLQADLRLTVPDPAGGVAVPAACVQWRIEQPWVRLADGGERPVQVLRRDGTRIVLAPGTLPADARLVPFP